MRTKWFVVFHDEFLEEFIAFPEEVQDAIASRAIIIEEIGPRLGRPYVDTLRGSKHNNMKEIRLNVESAVWRVAFAFDPKRNAILLVGGDKRGKDQKQFYKKLIKTADRRYKSHIKNIKT